MEIVGTIAGTLSLGITICDGIIKYCRSWKSQDGDVRALTALATRLKQLLQILDQRLQSNSAYDPMILQQVTSSIQDCTRHINSVVHLSDRYKSGQTGGLKGKAKHIVYKLKFPFEKQALDELRDIMVAFRGNVDTALQILTTHVLFPLHLRNETDNIPGTFLLPAWMLFKTFSARTEKYTYKRYSIFRTPVRKLRSR